MTSRKGRFTSSSRGTRRRRPRGAWIAASGLFLLTVISSAWGSEPYDWPLKKDRVITSSFGEYRPGRFHAGIDLRAPTIGEPVYAPFDGYVSRVRCSPWGYGKAIYITLADGNLVVFGHLSDFTPPIREYVNREQHARKNYTVDLYPEAGRFAVKQGDCIAYTGDTGVGPAHLHYELRDKNNLAINPRLLGISWKDTTPPIVRALLVAPRGPADNVNGDIIPQVIEVKAVGNGVYRCDPLRAFGEVGFAVDAYDPANEGQNRLGLYRVSALWEDKEIFRTQHDRISYDTMDQGVVCWHPYMLDKGKFMVQWRWQGNRSEAVSQAPTDGWWRVPQHETMVHLDLEDSGGNMVQVEIPIVPSNDLPQTASSSPESSSAKDKAGTIDIACFGEYVALTAEFPDAEEEPPVLRVSGGNPEDLMTPFRRVSSTKYRAGYRPAKASRNVTLWADHPRIAHKPFDVIVFHRGQTPREESVGDITISATSDTPFGILYVSVQESSTNRAKAPLPILGKTYTLWPESAPIDAPVTVRIPFPQGAQKAHRVDIYRKTNSGWSRESSRRSATSLEISTRRLGTFAAMEDTVSPTIREIKPADGATTGRRPEISAKVADIGSGIANTEITANGEWLLAAYDPEAETLRWTQDEDLPSGEVLLRFSVEDSAGNKTSAERRIHVGETTPNEHTP